MRARSGRKVIGLLTGTFIAFALPAAAQDIQFATFPVEGDTAYAQGELGEPTPAIIEKLLKDNPGLKKIVMTNVPGSDDDEANIKASIMVHEHGLTTYVPASGMIASGGVDFFLAGKERVIEEGACIGVHAWQDDDDPTPSSELPRDHPGHKVFLDYFKKIGMDEEFYWYTLRVAKFDDMYWLSTEELLKYGVVTKIIAPPEGTSSFQLICDHR
ncbi:alpha/beta hydrolase [Parvularcula marina]|uniref:Alpha/beta hydrolase n=1 Tax=Parvularcula marina TaxID=2292771 RepID=A0A371RHA2_9PROT|nr:alpha/beta hydrolase [Parvularcula marina]RFB04834.1 alpha/beta hydrolase [Parvularcula marina]